MSFYKDDLFIQYTIERLVYFIKGYYYSILMALLTKAALI